MDIIVLDSNLQRIAVVDQYKSLMWCKRYYDIGALDLQIEANDETVALFKSGNYIMRSDDDTVFRIEALELNTSDEETDYLIVGAYDCKEILNQRIVWSTINHVGTFGNYITKILNQNVINPTIADRKIENFALKDLSAFNYFNISQQTTYDNVAEKIIEVCKSYGIGWKITLENGVFYFDMYEGVDRTQDQSTKNPVIFSSEYENLFSAKYTVNRSDFKNVALIGGEGEGKDRKLATYGTEAGINRFEMFVDASSTSTDTEEELTPEEYSQMLMNRGKDEIAKNSVATSFEGEIDDTSYAYGSDYCLGDIVTLRNKYGISSNVRIVEVIETWDDEGHTVEPVFEEYADHNTILSTPEIVIQDLPEGKKALFKSNDANVVFHYTLNGSNPTIDSPIASEIEFTTPQKVTLKVVSELVGVLSPIRKTDVTVEQVEMPVLTVSDIDGGKSMAWTCSTGDVTFRHTEDGTVPTIETIPDDDKYRFYDLNRVGSVTITVRAWRTGYVPSQEVHQTMQVTQLPPPWIGMHRNWFINSHVLGYAYATVGGAVVHWTMMPQSVTGVTTNTSKTTVYDKSGIPNSIAEIMYMKAYQTMKGYVDSDEVEKHWN